MLTLKRWIAVPGLVTALFLTGCGDLSGGRRPGTDVRLTGFAIRDKHKEKDVWINAGGDARRGMCIPTYAPLPLNKDFKLHILGTANGKQQDYDALIGPDPDHPETPVAEVHSSAATVYVQHGWVVAVGRLPMGETGTTQTSSTGTTFVIRTTPERDAVYHLKDHHQKDHCVNVFIPKLNKTFPVEPGYYLLYEPASGRDPKIDQFADDDPFLKHVRSHADLAGLALE
jgi:hypothetical protein